MTFDREFKLKCDRFINLLNMLIKREKILYYQEKNITVGNETKSIQKIVN